MQSSSEIHAARTVPTTDPIHANNNLNPDLPQSRLDCGCASKDLRTSRFKSFSWSAVFTLSDITISALDVLKKLLPSAASASAALATVTKNTILKFDAETVLEYSLFTGQVDKNGNPCVAAGSRSFPMENIQGLNIANTRFIAPAMLFSVILYSLHNKVSFHIELSKLKNNITHALSNASVNSKLNIQFFKTIASGLQNLGTFGINGGLLAWLVPNGFEQIGFEGFNNLHLGDETETNFNLKDNFEACGSLGPTTVIAEGKITTPAIFTRGIKADTWAAGLFVAGMGALVIGKIIAACVQQAEVNAAVQKHVPSRDTVIDSNPSINNLADNIINELKINGLVTNNFHKALRSKLEAELTIIFPNLTRSTSALNQKVSIKSHLINYIKQSLSIKNMASISDYAGNLCLLSAWICYNFSKGFPGVSTGYNNLKTSPTTRFESEPASNNSTNNPNSFVYSVEFAPTRLQNIKSELLLPLFALGITLKGIGLSLGHVLNESDIKKITRETLTSERLAECGELSNGDLKKLSARITAECVNKQLIHFNHTNKKSLHKIQCTQSLSERIHSRLDKLDVNNSTMRESNYSALTVFKNKLVSGLLNTGKTLPIQFLYTVAGAGAFLGIFMMLAKDLTEDGKVQAQQPTLLNANVTVISTTFFGIEKNQTLPIDEMNEMNEYQVPNPSKVTFIGAAVGLGAAILFGGIASFFERLHQQHIVAKASVDSVQTALSQNHSVEDLESASM